MNADLTWSAWRKSSYSGAEHNCVEVSQAAWRTSSHSGAESNCVEVTKAAWCKSSHSGQASDCVEVAQAAWRTSSHSGQESNCVEVTGNPPAIVGVRDSKDPGGSTLTFAPRAWRGFIAAVKSGEFD